MLPCPLAGSLYQLSALTVGGFTLQVKGSIASSSRLELTTAVGGAAQVFVAAPAPNNFWIQTASGGLCLDLANGNTAAGSPVQVYTCLSPYPNMNPSQWWAMDALGRLHPRKAAHMCLDVTSLSSGGQLLINPCSSSQSQVFTVSTAGVCTTTPTLSNGVFSCNASTPTNGTCGGSCGQGYGNMGAAPSAKYAHA